MPLEGENPALSVDVVAAILRTTHLPGGGRLRSRTADGARHALRLSWLGVRDGIRNWLLTAA